MWVPSLTLAGLAVRRLAHQWPLALAQLLGITAAVTLAASIPLMQSAAAEAGLGQALSAIGAGGSIEIQQAESRSPATYDDFQASSAKVMTAEFGGDFVPGARYGLTSPLNALTHNGKDVTGEGGDPKEPVRYYESVQSRVQLVAGAWAAAAGAPPGYNPMSVSQALAERISLKPGDTYCLRLPTYFRPRFFHQPPPPLFPACFFLSAIWTPISANDPYWGGEPPTGFVLDRETYFRVLASLIPVVPPDVPASIEPSGAYAGQYWAPDLAHLHAPDAPKVLSTLTKVQGEFTVGREVSFITGLPAALRNFEARLDNARLAGLLVQVSLLAIAFYAVGLMGGLFLDGQLAAVALWRARGWSRRRLWWLLMLQFAIISLLAAPLGLALAYKTVQLLAAGVLGPTAQV